MHPAHVILGATTCLAFSLFLGWGVRESRKLFQTLSPGIDNRKSPSNRRRSYNPIAQQALERGAEREGGEGFQVVDSPERYSEMDARPHLSSLSSVGLLGISQFDVNVDSQSRGEADSLQIAADSVSEMQANSARAHESDDGAAGDRSYAQQPHWEQNGEGIWEKQTDQAEGSSGKTEQKAGGSRMGSLRNKAKGLKNKAKEGVSSATAKVTALAGDVKTKACDFLKGIPAKADEYIQKAAKTLNQAKAAGSDAATKMAKHIPKDVKSKCSSGIAQKDCADSLAKPIAGAIAESGVVDMPVTIPGLTSKHLILANIRQPIHEFLQKAPANVADAIKRMDTPEKTIQELAGIVEEQMAKMSATIKDKMDISKMNAELQRIIQAKKLPITFSCE